MLNGNDKKVAVIIPAFGDLGYTEKAEVAYSSACDLVIPSGFKVTVMISNEPSLLGARNGGAKLAIAEGADWLIFLDADDSLDRQYLVAAAPLFKHADIIKPATLGVYPDGATDDESVMIPWPKNPLEKNHIVIGAPVRASLFEQLGGFSDLPALEDWDLWLRLQQVGARVMECPDAVYRVGVNPDSRNQDVKAHHTAYRHIRAQKWNFPS